MKKSIKFYNFFKKIIKAVAGITSYVRVVVNSVKNYIESGILEMYVLGITTTKENEEVMRMVFLAPDVQHEIEKITSALHRYVNLHHIHPKPSLKKSLLKMIRDLK